MDMLFDQKSPALSVLVVDRGDIKNYTFLYIFFFTDILDTRLNWPRGQFSEIYHSRFNHWNGLYELPKPRVSPDFQQGVDFHTSW